MKTGALGGSPGVPSCSWWIHLDIRAERREATHQRLGQPCFVQLVEIGLPEIPIGLAGGQPVLGGNQNLVREGHGRAWRAASSFEAEKLRLQVTRPVTHHCVSRLHQCLVKRTWDTSLALVPSALIVTRADPRPRFGMMRALEHPHLCAQLPQEDRSHDSGNPGNLHQPLMSRLHRLQFLRNPLAQFREQALQMIQLAQLQVQNKTMVVFHMAFQGERQRARLLAQRPLRQLGHLLGRHSASDEGAQQRHLRPPQHIAGEAGQFHIGGFQSSEPPVAGGRPRLNQFAAIPEQLAQLPERLGGTKLFAIKPWRTSSASHPRSLTSVFRPGTCLICCALPTMQLTGPFQNRIHRLPVDAGALHTDRGTALRSEPIP